MRKERIGKIGYRICAVLAAAVSLWCMGDNLWPVVKENGAVEGYGCRKGNIGGCKASGTGHRLSFL